MSNATHTVTHVAQTFPWGESLSGSLASPASSWPVASKRRAGPGTQTVTGVSLPMRRDARS
jgi:hypothetical protein